MSKPTADRLKSNTDRIMQSWAKRALAEVSAVKDQRELVLWNSLPAYLGHLADALSKTIDRTEARKLADFNEGLRLGKKHGHERAGSLNYTIDQVITEYHILRQVLCDVLEEDAILTPGEREIIVCSIEQAVNNAATQFSNTLRDIQERLTHTLAHDLRNPLSAAKMNAQLILRRPNDIDHCIKSASRICMNMDRLDSMIHDLLDASRIRAGQSLPLEFEICDLDMIARQICEEANFSHQNRLVIFSKGICLGYWSESGLRRVLENLVSNAAKYSAPNSIITVTVKHDLHDALITVHNVGNPIPISEQEILFQQFRRSRATETKTGWGLGLTVVKGITEAHRGTVAVRSDDQSGTTFTIKLPRDFRTTTELTPISPKDS